MNIQTNVPLKDLTTFKIGGSASYFALVRNLSELKEALAFAKEKNVPWLVLGGGSNVLVSDRGFRGLVMKLLITGMEFTDSGDTVVASVGAGESWDGFVAEAVKRGLGGVENLSGIPGSVGAAPVQNIGAYGVEVKDTIDRVCVYNTQTSEVAELTGAACGFAYRDSIFKKPEGKQYIITKVEFRLKKHPQLTIEYKDLAKYFLTKKISPTLETVRNAVLEVRRGKFPDLSTHGTAGSFFKNPIIEMSRYHELLKNYPDLPHYKLDDGRVKIPLAWILDNVCMLKGVKHANVGAFERQALVLVNFGGATAKDVLAHAKEISRCVLKKTGIVIEPEVEFIGILSL